MNAAGLSDVQSVPVLHCHQAFGVVLHHHSGWKLVYSGDTRPCRALTTAGKGCTLLIHEATFEPDLHGQALQKRHSTVEEALQMAADMGAWRTILTHFSQRYPKLPVGLPANGSEHHNVMLAFDGMCVPFKLLLELPRVLPAIACAFAEPGEADAHQQGAVHVSTT